MAPRKLNVLVYSGTGTTSESVRHCLWTLRQLLYPNYAVIPIAEAALLKEPWMSTCALLVIPGGADLCYCRVLNGSGNRRIAQYVRGGGRYLGFCAGGYYGSGVCEFEVGNRDLEVVGRRELCFFPGICRGGAYRGFQYSNESGARAVQITVHAEAFASVGSGDVPSTVYSYYNGGGVFVDVPAYASRVQVLASYPDDLAVDGGGSRAAVVYCTVGEGAALLTGPHPEFDPAQLSQHPELPNYQALITELQKNDESRTKFLRACLAKLGLEVASGSSAVPNRNEGNVAAKLPQLTSLHIASLYPDEAQELALEWRDMFTRDESRREFLRAEADTFRVLQPDAGTGAWPAAANTTPDRDQPFGTAMLMDLVDRALRYPKLAELIERVATVNVHQPTTAAQQDTDLFRGLLVAVAEHAEEDESGRAAVEAEDIAAASLPVDELLERWQKKRMAFDRLVNAVFCAVTRVLLHNDRQKVPVLDSAIRQEMWSALVYARQLPAHLADVIARGDRSQDDDSSPEDGRTMYRLVLYEAAWPARVAAFDYSAFYAGLIHYRQTAPTLATATGEYCWGNQLMYGKVVTSTNTLLERNTSLTATLPTGFTLTATTQLAGRGRGANVWLAPSGQLILSTVIHHPLDNNRRPVVFLQYLAAIAIVEAIEAYAPGFARLGVRLKWPNDIYAPDPDNAPGSGASPYVKIGGILAQCSFSGGMYRVVLGIGLNATNQRPTTSLEALARSQDNNSHSPLAPVVNERLLACLLTRLEAVYAQFCRDGFVGDLEKRYYRRWLHTDQIVTLEAVEGQPRARVLGITPDWGLLRVAEVVSDGPGTADRPTGRVWTLQSDENSFDYWRGLVRTKT